MKMGHLLKNDVRPREDTRQAIFSTQVDIHKLVVPDLGLEFPFDDRRCRKFTLTKVLIHNIF